jgi:hypothetical protein
VEIINPDANTQIPDKTERRNEYLCLVHSMSDFLPSASDTTNLCAPMMPVVRDVIGRRT